MSQMSLQVYNSLNNSLNISKTLKPELLFGILYLDKRRRIMFEYLLNQKSLGEEESREGYAIEWQQITGSFKKRVVQYLSWKIIIITVLEG